MANPLEPTQENAERAIANPVGTLSDVFAEGAKAVVETAHDVGDKLHSSIRKARIAKYMFYAGMIYLLARRESK